MTSRKSRISLARQLHLSRLVEEGVAAGQSSTRNHSVHEAQFCCCPCGPLPTRHPHCGRHRHTIYHWDFLTFCSIFPFHPFLVSFFVPCSKGITRVWGFKVRFSFLSSTPRTRMWSWSVYCLHPESQDQVPVLKERGMKNQGGQKSVYGRSVREASVYILSAADRRTGLVWPLFLLNNWILESLEPQ